MRIEADSERITYQVCDDRKGGATLEAESSGTVGEAGSTEASADRATALDEAIIKFLTEHPDKLQGEVEGALKGLGYKQARSTIHARIKVLSEGGKLPGWQNRPETHKVEEHPASEGDEN